MKKYFILSAITFLFIGYACKKKIPAPLPIANFFVENNGCTTPCKLYFYGQSKNAVKWNWNFGNGSSSTFEDDSVSFIKDTTYQVWLYIWNVDNAKDSIRKSVTLH